ncbi:MAG: NAD-dependent epimerase/dehydratase family protein [Acidimicrobiales bacterium]|jgi:nucleoside-diphosphate-sugar epimerase|nr:NAD-dependent epimerase/dehydratase family protein [Acidimicrobiales bacterium]MDP6900545.1 NAD-dependent epimerase/dehydratase family protein [Acidimicrobiales bacterium]
MTTVAISGAEGALRSRISEALTQLFDQVISFTFGLDEVSLTEVESVIHLAFSEDSDQRNLIGLLELASEAEISRLVVVSSAMVYGAWPNNSVPLSEDAAVRPNPESTFAVHQADAERTALEWADLNPDRQVTILRPTAVASPNASGLIGEALLAAAPIRTRRDDPPQQFVHLDDLATAVATVVQLEDSGVFNVAPDGWLTAREVRDLVGARPTIRLPVPLPGRLDRYVARRVGHQAPTGLLPYTRYPWVVANDRLRSTGWVPRYGNDQVFVAADAGMPWDSMNAKQRQNVSLGLGATAVIGLLYALGSWLKRTMSR